MNIRENGYQNNNNKTAILKVQAAYNITRREFIRLDITSFRDNDQGYHPNSPELKRVI